MKRTLNRLLALILSILMLCTAVMPISAAETNLTNYTVENSNTVTPYLNNYFEHSFHFGIDNTGNADVVITYIGEEEYFTQAKITVKIQKRVLLLFWTTVDIGEPDNIWTETSTEVYGSFIKSFQIEKTGTYRAVITFEVSGTGGATDVVEETLEVEYK